MSDQLTSTAELVAGWLPGEVQEFAIRFHLARGLRMAGVRGPVHFLPLADDGSLTAYGWDGPAGPGAPPW